MERQKAIDLINEMVPDQNLRNHMLATESVMRALAERFGEDPERWALAGLVHDLDYRETVDDFPRHGYVSAEILREKGVDEDILEQIQSCEEFGMSLDEFLELSLNAMVKVAREIGL
jgi:putative nucleotidyltransferase with HDIG domain